MNKWFSQLSDNEKKVFLVAMFFVVLSFLDFSFFRPAVGKLINVERAIGDQKNSVQKDLRFLTYKDKIMKESELFKKYFTVNVEEDNVVKTEFLSAIEQIASQSKVSLIKSNPSDIKKKKNVIEYYANLDCTGSLENVIKFMHAINATDSLLKIVKVNITPKRGNEQDVNVSMVIMKLVVPKGTNLVTVQ